ncbi:MAG: sugar-binding protein [Anaerolineae bacterium]
MQCPQCGAQNPTGNMYCGRCGAMLPTSGEAAAGGAPPSYPAPTQESDPYQAPPSAWQPKPQVTHGRSSRPWLIAFSLLLFGALALLLLIGSRLNSRSESVTPEAVAQTEPTPTSNDAGTRASPLADKPSATAQPAAQAQPPVAAPANVPPAAQPAAPAPPAADGPPDTEPELTAPRVGQPPAIDGQLGEWQGASQAVDAVVFGQENMSGVADLGGRVWFEWNDAALYVAVLVIDDTLSQPSAGRNLYLGDSIEIQWDTNPPGSNPAAWDADDWHIGLSPGNFQDRPPASYVWTPRDAAGADLGIQMAARPFMNNGQYQGYTIEAAIPWSLVNVRPKAGQTFRLAVAISDDDIPQAVQQSMVCTSPGRLWHRPDTLNTFTLK